MNAAAPAAAATAVATSNGGIATVVAGVGPTAIFATMITVLALGAPEAAVASSTTAHGFTILRNASGELTTKHNDEWANSGGVLTSLNTSTRHHNTAKRHITSIVDQATTSPSTPPSAAQCVHMNDVLWEYRRDATTQPSMKAVFAFFYCIIILFGVLGNLCVILSISRTKSLQTVPNMFIFSLSCSDIVVCCTSATITPITAFQKEWLFGSFLCSVAPFIAGVSLCFSTFTLAAISLDRFMLIRFPMKKPFSHAQALVIICLICILAAGLSLPIVFMQRLRPIDKYCGEFCYEDWGAAHSQRRAYGTLMLTLQFIIPLAVIVFCYTAISVRLKHSLIFKSKHGTAYQWQLQMTEQQRAATKRRQRTNRMFIAMVVAFSASWIWTLLFNILRDYEIFPDFVKRQEFFFGILTHCIAMTSTVWNPLLYALLNLQLRAAFLQLMPKCVRAFFRTRCTSNDATLAQNVNNAAGGAQSASPQRTPLVGDSTRPLHMHAHNEKADYLDGIIVNKNTVAMNGRANRNKRRRHPLDSSSTASSLRSTISYSGSDEANDRSYGSYETRDAKTTNTVTLIPTTTSELAIYECEPTISAKTCEKTNKVDEDSRVQQRLLQSYSNHNADTVNCRKNCSENPSQVDANFLKYGSFDVTVTASLAKESRLISYCINTNLNANASMENAPITNEIFLTTVKNDNGRVMATITEHNAEPVELGPTAAVGLARSAERKRFEHELGERSPDKSRGDNGRDGCGGDGINRARDTSKPRVAIVWRRFAHRCIAAYVDLDGRRQRNEAHAGGVGYFENVQLACCDRNRDDGCNRRHDERAEHAPQQRDGCAAGMRASNDQLYAACVTLPDGGYRRTSLSPLFTGYQNAQKDPHQQGLSFDASDVIENAGAFEIFKGNSAKRRSSKLLAYRTMYRNSSKQGHKNWKSCQQQQVQDYQQDQYLVDECLAANAAKWARDGATRANERATRRESGERRANGNCPPFYCTECRHNSTAVCDLYGCECCASPEARRKLNTQLRATLSQPQTPRSRTSQSPRNMINTLNRGRSTPSVLRKSLSFRGGAGAAPRCVRRFVNRLSPAQLSNSETGEWLVTSEDRALPKIGQNIGDNRAKKFWSLIVNNSLDESNPGE